MTRQKRTFVVMSLSVVLAAVASFAVYRVIQRLPAREVEVPSAQVVVAAKREDVEQVVAERWPARGHNSQPTAEADAHQSDATARHQP